MDLLISMQASDGGLPSYECERGGKFLESLNPAELYGTLVHTSRGRTHVDVFMFIDDIMIEYSYPECTVSVITALVEFQRRYSYRSADIE